MSDGVGVSRMLERYRPLLRRFVTGEVSAALFESEFLERFKTDPAQVAGAEFDILDGLFADVDDFVDDPVLRAKVGGIGGDELRTRAATVYTRLFESR